MVITMYVTTKEIAEYLEYPIEYIEELIRLKKIKAVFDGEQYLINKDQFSTHLKQVELYKEMILEYLNEPIPEDIDIKDED